MNTTDRSVVRSPIPRGLGGGWEFVATVGAGPGYAILRLWREGVAVEVRVPDEQAADVHLNLWPIVRAEADRQWAMVNAG